MSKEHTTSEDNQELTTSLEKDDRYFVAIPFSFNDPWAQGKDPDVSFAFRFAKPTRTQMKRLSAGASRDMAQASRDLLLGTVHPADKALLLEAMEEYPGVTTSYATALIKGVGLSSDVGN